MNWKTIGTVVVTIIMLILCFLPLIPELDELNTPYYIVPISILTALVVFMVVPYFTDYIYERNVKFKDLVDHFAMQPDEKIKYLTWHRYLLFVLSSCVIGCLVYYYVFEFRNSSLTWFEMTGMVRGIVTYYYDIQHVISRYIKNFLHSIKEYVKKQKSISESPSLTFTENDSIQMNNIVV